MKQDIRLGLALYSFTSEYINRKMTLEEILKQAQKMGCRGIEIIPAQMAPCYPHITGEWVEELKRLLEKYNLEPVCWGAYLDRGTVTGRDLTEDEIFQYTIRELVNAKKAGFQIVRTQHTITPKILKALIPYCRSLDMKLGIEIFPPLQVETELWDAYFDIMRGEGKGCLGIIPDFGIFMNRPHRLWLEQAIECGFRPRLLKRVHARFLEGASFEEAVQGVNERETEITKEMYGTFGNAASPSWIKELAEISFYMHGKFYYMDETAEDDSIPYEEVLRNVVESGYQGYLACEYEGHHFSDMVSSAEQAERYVSMCKRILADI